MDSNQAESLNNTGHHADLELHELEIPSTVPGFRVFSISIEPDSNILPEPVVNDSQTNTHIYRKVFPGLRTPFNLPIECFPKFEKLLDKRPDMVPAVNVMMEGAIAESTASQYSAAVREFHQFCVKEKLPFPRFTEAAVLEFVAVAFTGKRPLGVFRTLLPALAMLEKVTGCEDSALSEHLRSAVYSVQRYYEQRKPAVKKAQPLDFTVVNTLIALEILPFVDSPDEIDPFHFRTLFRATVTYFTACRFADFAKLTDKEFEFNGDTIRITFLTRKNDQHGKNSIHIIAKRPECAVCPVRLIRLYFWRFNLDFKGTGKLVNFYLGHNAGTVEPVGTGSLSRSNAQKSMKILLLKHGFHEQAEFYTEKCLKVGVVSNMMDHDQPLEHVQVVGGWSSLTTPLHYKHSSERFKKRLAKHLPLGPRPDSPEPEAAQPLLQILPTSQADPVVAGPSSSEPSFPNLEISEPSASGSSAAPARTTAASLFAQFARPSAAKRQRR